MRLSQLFSFLRGSPTELKQADIETKEASFPVGYFGLDPFILPNTLSGPVVTPETAMTVPTVRATVELIATALGALPLKAFERLPDGSKRPAPKHSAYKVAHDAANDWQSAGELRQQLATDALLYGNAFAYPVLVNGRVAELIRLDPRTVEIRKTDSAAAPVYVVRTT